MLDEPVEVVLVKDLIQSRIERMRGTAWAGLALRPHRRRLRKPPSFAHRHAPSEVARDIGSRASP
jgi:hypothetical protein